MSGKNTHDLIAGIFADTSADLDEMVQLRAEIDRVQDEVGGQDGEGGIVVATSKAFEVTRILVEEGIMKTRHRGRDPVDQSQLRSIVTANLAYLQATLGVLPDQASPQ
ncbi:MAG: hypothetical protein M3492_09305 [Actinomycetota bacterium]|jgi:predicted Mrr-cat superfamily restriction endonuclease|nr:hypothetical protein [Actinomycetota bacterium]